MPAIKFGDNVVQCKAGENLRRVLLRHRLPLYNGIAAGIHCRGLGTCGTCAVEIDGEVSGPTQVEKWRLNFPPHKGDGSLRLACQCVVLGDLVIQKHGGMWGHVVDEPESGPT